MSRKGNVVTKKGVLERQVGMIYVFSDAAGASGQWLSPQQLNQMAEWSFMLG